MMNDVRETLYDKGDLQSTKKKRKSRKSGK